MLLAASVPVAGAGAGEIGDFADLDLEELLDVNVYAAAKHEQEIAESPSTISVITHEEIENSACTDVTCLLRRLPEVDVMWLRPLYVAVGARALTDALGDKVLVMVDGREVNDEIFGVVWWQGLPVHLQDIERIEVIRGPGSALYGANAHSLVVSITSRKHMDETAEVFLGSGEHDRSSLHARLSHDLGDWRLSVFGGAETGGHLRIQDYRERQLGRIRARLDHETQSSSSTVEMGLVMAEGGIYTTMAPAWAHDALLGHLLFSHKAEIYRAQVSFNFLDAGFTWDLPLTFRGIKLGEPPGMMGQFSSSLDGELQASWSPFENNLWISGCNYRWITFLSDDNQPGTIHQHRVGLFLHNEQRLLRDLILTLGVRFDYNSITPFTISPRLAGVWHFAEEQFLRVAVGQAFRKPSFFNTHIHVKGFKGEAGFEELEDFFIKSIGNPDLENESITTVEAGYRGRFLRRRVYAEVVGFYNRYRNSIAMITDMAVDQFGMPDLSRSEFQFENTGREVDSLGGSLSLDFQISRAFRAHANYTFRYSWYISPPGETLDDAVSMKKGDRVPWEPVHMFNLWCYYLTSRGLRVGASLHGRSSSQQSRTEHGGLFDRNIALHNPAIGFIGAFASWRFFADPGWLELGVRAYNLLNVGFRDNMAITRPDGTEVGGEMIGRRIFFFLRGAI
jgi:outer membrane receptor for ferrienterochelin and colicin